ncbi:MAG TPA: carboxypeptidase-like regulatory domain-containing protein, partial [Thermoanaerobaculia bacterium]|nr:carboxypeptidase-like regulatory domain-containing protein [Thermoanaerobaculia bacterium]
MTPTPRRAAAGALAALLLTALAALAAVPAAGQPSVTGRVVGSEGDPVAGARVELRLLISDHASAEADLSDRFTAPSVASATTGDDGRFALDAPRVGLWDLVVSARGKAPEALLVGPLFEPTALPPIVLGDGRELAVRVVDTADEPVRGAL